MSTGVLVCNRAAQLLLAGSHEALLRGKAHVGRGLRSWTRSACASNDTRARNALPAGAASHVLPVHSSQYSAARFVAVPAAAATPTETADAPTPAPPLSQASSRTIQAHQSQARMNLAHWLHTNAGASHSARADGLRMFETYLKQAKHQLEQEGRTEMCIDTAIIDSYLLCEDKQIRHHYTTDTLPGLASTLSRLSMIIQNLPLLIVPTRDAEFDKRLLHLFRAYFTAANFVQDMDRAHAAWQSLHRSGQRNVLEDPIVALDYMSTVIYGTLRRCEELHSAERRVLEREAMWGPYQAACEELMSWSLPDPDAPQQRVLPPSPLQDDAATGAGSQRTRNLARIMPEKELRSLNDLYCSAMRVECSRSRMDSGAFPNMARLGKRHAEIHRSGSATRARNVSLDLRTTRLVLMLLTDRAWQLDSIRDSVTILLPHLLTCLTIQLPVLHSMHHGAQLLDEGLALSVLHLCCALGDGRNARKVFVALRESLASLPHAGKKRTVTPGGVRRPQPSTYHALIHACVADREWDSAAVLHTALKTLGELENDYKAYTATLDSDWSALEPTRGLQVLAERIGESAESWNSAWAQLERLDAQHMDEEPVPLRPAQIYVMLIALRDLPSDAVLKGPQPPDQQGAQQGVEDNRISRAISLIDMLQHGFDQKLGINAFNALLPIMITARDPKTASMYLLNVLDRMSELKLSMNHETGVLLCKYWLSKKMYKAFIAVLEDMIELKLLLPYVLMQDARIQASAEGNGEDARAIWDLIVQHGGWATGKRDLERDRASSPLRDGFARLTDAPGRTRQLRHSGEDYGRNRSGDRDPPRTSPDAPRDPDAERAWASGIGNSSAERAAAA